MSVLDRPGHIDFDELRRRHPILEYCRAQGIELTRCGSTWVTKCPIHQERKGKSFSIWEDGRWQCFGKCSKGGDVIDLELALGGGNLHDAIERLGGASPVTDYRPPSAEKREEKPLPTKDNPLLFPHRLTGNELIFCRLAAERLSTSPELIEKVSTWRNWRPETIRGLALDGDLGITADGRVAFLYESGMKARPIVNVAPGEDRRIRWVFGKPWLWRAGLIRASTQTVIICEGETDAITLIDDGIDLAGETCVVSLPGASFKIEPWTFIFSGKCVLIATDNDEAGQKAAAYMASALRETAVDVKQFDLGGMDCG